MKQYIVILIGVGILATAGATAVSTPTTTSSQMDIAHHGVLTAEQTKLLQAKYRYWSSSQATTLKAPI